MASLLETLLPQGRRDSEMLKRIGIIAWWLGLGCLGSGVAKFLAGGPLVKAVAFGSLWGSAWLLCWGIAFIVGGSFWKPPK